MPLPKRLDDYLKEHHTDCKTITHPEAYTAQEIAAAMHVHGHQLAKSVMVKADGRFVMAVLPATLKVDFERLKEVLGQKDVRLASEEEFKGLFPDCEPGAEPPFGNLYDIETIVDNTLAEDERIYFNAGNHYEAHEMEYREYEELVKPRVEKFAVH